ncbi:uncharacterized protein N7459_006075 [Penicillium hispanicum]|uniref:uncharacterized protein n=1 Tax=Penicillium hispanicum TaxID=1080232 RepID=UPI00254155FE|nr:uncharacterized protein N7459_006075 [Penicillium hispanicum]KAJ5580090.1 hypothetical protein N7459_006075 [Penicillium hispanicum]
MQMLTQTDDGFPLRLSLSMPDKKEEIEAGTLARDNTARREASLILVAKLEEAGIWDHLLQIDPPLSAYPSLALPHDLSRLQGFLQAHPANIDVKIPSTCETPHTCYLVFHVPNSEQMVEATAIAATKKQAKKEALQLLIKKLQATGIWDRIFSNPTLNDTSKDTSEDISKKARQDDLQAFHILWSQKKISVSVNFEVFSGEDGDMFTCYAHLSIPDRGKELEVTAEAPGKASARQKAFLSLILKLREAGIWESLVQPGISQAELTVDDDLLWVMNWAKNDLVHTEDLAKVTILQQPEQITSWKPKLIIENDCNPGRSKELSKKLHKLHGPDGQDVIAHPFQRMQLPVNQLEQPIFDLINDHTYSIIVAQTGSGKSTQVPQIILNHAIKQGSGGECRVLCVQPRRLAVRLLSERVAHERNESVGDTVGYAVRFDHNYTVQGGTITYCTSGIMLNMLQNNPSMLNWFSHIILDEVHVRDVSIDFVMLLLKRKMDQLLGSGAPTPKVTIMSATMDVELFSSYFRNRGPEGTLVPAPHISIPGRQYHVKQHYLDDVLEDLTNFFEPASLETFLSHPETRKFLQLHYETFGDLDMPDGESFETTEETSTKLSSPRPIGSDLTSDAEDPLMPLGLISAKILHILSTTETGAILVFLPGLKQILDIEQHLQYFAKKVKVDLWDANRFQILTLHAQLPEEMEKLSLEVPPGCRRIFFSTDVAEASVTIPDVKYVVDTGKVHQMTFNSRTKTSKLACCWVSQSSARQRAGRAGRVQDGEYFFFGTKARYDSLRVTNAPEMLRTNLQGTCLRAKQIVPDSPISKLLEQAIDPPMGVNVREAIQSLKQLQALDRDENITSLGKILVQLPLDPAFGKMIILGIIFRCLHPLLILGVMGEDARLFRWGKSLDERIQVRDDRVHFSEQTSSDHISLINGFSAVRKAMHEQGDQAAFHFAFSRNISFRAYREASKAAGQILSVLNRTLPQLVPHHFHSERESREHQYGGKELNTNSQNYPLIQALLLHCLYPRVAVPRGDTSNFYSTNLDPKVRLHGFSVARSQGPSHCLVAFNTKFWHPRAGLDLINLSLVSPLMACLFGGRLQWKNNIISMDSWMHLDLDTQNALASDNEVAKTVIELHRALDQALAAAFQMLSINLRSYHPSKRSTIRKSRAALFASLERTVTQILARDRCRFPTSAVSSSLWDEHDLHRYEALDDLDHVP